ncbi:hypothetical protein AKAW_00102 [Aspergillus luchuensis IFO 4308]|nr:hypothetical protein AKAW_00102 [Aspergillus luchuensis IFO 4308]
MSVRKAHNAGRNHLRNVLEYYQQIGQEKAQSVIDSITSSYAAEGQAVPNPAMAPPGAYPPPFGFPGRPGQLPPPPFGMPPLGAPGAPGMPPPPGARGLPFPPPFPGPAGAAPPAGLPLSPTCPRAPRASLLRLADSLLTSRPLPPVLLLPGSPRFLPQVKLQQDTAPVLHPV